ncbi:MAG: signal recognition particle-docking protein FtsY [Candidatus Methylomirabilia bacterium]
MAFGLGGDSRGLFARLKAGLAKTHDGFINQVERLILRRNRLDGELLDELEELYLQGDVGPRTTEELMTRLRRAVARNEVRTPEEVLGFLKAQALEILSGCAGKIELPAQGVGVILLVGTNGSGKTTTVAKLGRRLQREGRRVILAAADTFRAAAAEQLEIWGERAGLEVISQKPGSDPAAVVYDTLNAAIARGCDTVIVDTAGRMHTKVNLMEEMKKIRRAAGKLVPGSPHETLLVLDATTGQNAFSQLRLFHEAVGLTGLVLTKLDGTARGGVVLGLAREFPVPVKLVGVGEKIEDLQDFDAAAFVDALYDR